MVQDREPGQVRPIQVRTSTIKTANRRTPSDIPSQPSDIIHSMHPRIISVIVHLLSENTAAPALAVVAVPRFGENNRTLW
jgi:hypothetical protein